MAGSVSALCGRLLVCGLSGHGLSEAERKTLAAGTRAGVVLFRRNIAPGLGNVTGLVSEIVGAGGPDMLVAVDQEGGRVMRLGPPALQLPPMRALGGKDLGTIAKVAEVQGRELARYGFTMSFAPVVDIHTREENPIIGDRAFGTTAAEVAERAGAFADGLRAGGILSCAKHFPGHGDTTEDSHLSLPHVDRDREGLQAIEIAPFRAIAKRVDSMMTAHVVYRAYGDEPATMTHAICTDLLRGSIGFEGVLFSDDLEMKAIAIEHGEAAVRSIVAGCDVLLVCSRADLADRVHEALVVECEKSPAFKARCEEAAARSDAMRARVRPQPSAGTPEEIAKETQAAIGGLL